MKVLKKLVQLKSMVNHGFIGKDVAKVLGCSNPQKALRDHVDIPPHGLNFALSQQGERAPGANTQ